MSSRKSTFLHKKNPKNNILTGRRMIRSLYLRKLLLTHHTIQVWSERTSVFISRIRRKLTRKISGSVTVEASAAVPLFFFAVVCLFYFMEMMAVQTAIRSGLQYAGKEVAQSGYERKVIPKSQIQGKIIQGIGEERLERSIIVGGGRGIDCGKSMISPLTGIGNLTAQYAVRIPVPVFRIGNISCEETMKIKVWNGYRKTVFGGQDSKIVYVTENGIVYHTNYHCTYLEPSIHMVTAESLKTARNEDGGKYHRCERCGAKGAGEVYITDYGDRYHSSLRCGGLKRTVYAVDISEISGKSACSKCEK